MCSTVSLYYLLKVSLKATHPYMFIQSYAVLEGFGIGRRRRRNSYLTVWLSKIRKFYKSKYKKYITWI